MKLCIDCKYYTPDRDLPNYPQYSRCAHHTQLSPVDGEPIHFCSIVRSSSCGLNAELFEPATLTPAASVELVPPQAHALGAAGVLDL